MRLRAVLGAARISWAARRTSRRSIRSSSMARTTGSASSSGRSCVATVRCSSHSSSKRPSRFAPSAGAASANSRRRSVTPLIADTTTAVGRDCFSTRETTCWMRSALARLVPPNLWTVQSSFEGNSVSICSDVSGESEKTGRARASWRADERHRTTEHEGATPRQFTCNRHSHS